MILEIITTNMLKFEKMFNQLIKSSCFKNESFKNIYEFFYQVFKSWLRLLE